MAGLKKKKKEKSTSPNVVLVIFLVLFVITSITLGVLLYYANDETTDARRKRIAAEKSLNGEKKATVLYQMLWRDLRSALGDKLDADEIQQLSLDRASFEKGEFDDVAKNKDNTKKMAASLAAALVASDKGYDKSYPELLKAAEDEVAKLKGQANAEVARHEQTKAQLGKLTAAQQKSYTDAETLIKDGNNAALAAAKKQTEAFASVQKNNASLNQELRDKEKEMEALKEDHSNSLKLLARQIKGLKAELVENAKAGGPGGAQVTTRADAVPLLLDISTGKPLWDQPVGKITRVDLDLRQVVINVGSVHGAKPELTFNIFGASASGRPEKHLKGSIEIIKVLDTNSSLARITSLYDSAGYEIPLNAQARGRIARENEAPLREGDLLFNLFWTTRVAVAGYVNVTGEPSDSPAEQIRQMDDFLFLLRRNGIQVDAYVDLRDGQIRGNINARTRYLIRGDDLRVAGGKAKMPDEEKEKEPAAAEGQANVGRNEMINKSSTMLRNDAKTLGLLMISAENFATVIGYRRARNANSAAVSSFRPSLPYIGNPDGGVFRQPEKAAPDKEK